MDSLQERYAPHARCFGCGPANTKGLRIRSFEQPDGHVVVDFTPELHHEAFENVLNGGIIGTVLDCHMNWTTIHKLATKGTALTAPGKSAVVMSIDHDKVHTELTVTPTRLP